MPTEPPPDDQSAIAQAVHRRLVRVLADLGIAPHVSGGLPWVVVRDRVMAFGELNVQAAARLANVLEDLAARVDAPCTNGVNRDHDDPTSSDFSPTPDPVASPYDPGYESSRFHPRMHR